MKSIDWFRTCLMRIGIAYDLKTHVVHEGPQPDDMLEEYDSPETISALAGALRALGCDTIELGGGRGFLERMLAAPGCVDLVFNIAEGQRSRSREAHVPAVCEMLGVPYTHSDPLTLAMTLDKELTKRIAASHGIATAPFCLIERTSDVADAPIPPFPIIAKPNGEGSSMGIRRNAVCRDRAALACRVEALLANYRQPVLVESFLPGTEVTVAVMGDGPGAHALGAMEIAPRDGGAEHFIYGVETKRNYLAEVDYHVPPRLPAATLGAIEAVALVVYRVLGCRDVARIDLRLDRAGEPCLLEVNALPGLDPARSDLPILCSLLGISYQNLIGRIVRHSAERWRMSLPQQQPG
jgi:D-alanine-D-alanine ligase